MSMYSLLGLGSTVIGGPLVGWISQHWSPRVGIGVAGAATVAASVTLTLFAHQSGERRDQPGLVPVDIPTI
jgi:hypothetical protein